MYYRWRWFDPRGAVGGPNCSSAVAPGAGLIGCRRLRGIWLAVDRPNVGDGSMMLALCWVIAGCAYRASGSAPARGQRQPRGCWCRCCDAGLGGASGAAEWSSRARARSGSELARLWSRMHSSSANVPRFLREARGGSAHAGTAPRCSIRFVASLAHPSAYFGVLCRPHASPFSLRACALPSRDACTTGVCGSTRGGLLAVRTARRPLRRVRD